MSRKFLILFVLVLNVLNAKVLFRYNSDLISGSNVQSPIVSNQIQVSEYLPDEEMTARGAEGWGFSTMKMTQFNTDSSYIYYSDEIVSSFFNDHAYSAEVWFKPKSHNGNLMSITDNYGDIVVSLTLNDGKINFKRNFQYKLFEIESSDTCQQQKWHYAHWISGTEEDTMFQMLFLDHQLVAKQREVITHYPIGFEYLKGYLKIGFVDSLTNSSYKGEIYAVEMKTEDLGTIYNNAYYPMDGSGYFGIPYFRYYYSGYDILQKQIRPSKTAIKSAIFVPYVNDGYIPQGLTNSYEDDNFSGDSGMVYISLYHREVDGSTGANKSIIVELDPNSSYQVRRCFRMIDALATAHMTALVYRGGNLFLTSSGKGYKLELPKYSGSGKERYQDLSYVWTESMYSSSATYYSDSIWCCTKFATDTSETAYLAGYPMDSLGNVNLSAKPIYYRLPQYVQGAAWTNFQGQDYLFVSASYGDADSKIYRYTKSNLSRWYLADPDTIFYVPAGTEDVTFNRDGNLMTSSESSALYYSSRASNPWSQYFPFIFEISKDVLFQDIISGQTNIQRQGKNNLPLEYELSVYPNPFNNQLNIHIDFEKATDSIVRIYGIRGQIVKSFPTELNYSNYINLVWNAESVSSGIYFISVMVADKSTVSKKVVLLK